ncbi:MAG: hypothetical protein AAFZ15_30915 [Bacteroidota bacterium]
MKDLTGVWKQTGGSPADKGTYYIRQAADSAGNQNVFWFGKQTGGDGWSNVLFGTISGAGGDTIGGNWADVPDGNNRGSGTLTLKITNGGDGIEYVAGDGNYFGGRTWVRQ